MRSTLLASSLLLLGLVGCDDATKKTEPATPPAATAPAPDAPKAGGMDGPAPTPTPAPGETKPAGEMKPGDAPADAPKAQ